MQAQLHPDNLTGRTTTGNVISDDCCAIDTATSPDDEDQWIGIKVTVEGVMREENVMEALRAKLKEMFDDPDPEIERVP
ncbi:uncharacterized protein LOC144590617 isoform X2 [Rhinoraja longicauda]